MPKKNEEKKVEVAPEGLKNKLYNMTKEQADIYMLIDQADGEITDEIETLLDKHEANVLGRAFSLKSIITRFEDKAKLAKEKKQEYAAIQKACENAVNAGKQFIKRYLIQSGESKLEYQAESISLRKTPDAVTITDEKLVPDKYKRYRTTLNSMHMKILIEGCEFAEIDMPVITKFDPEKDVMKTEIKEAWKADKKVGVSGTEITSDFSVVLKG